MILNLQNIYKDYQQDKLVVPVLKDVCLTVEEGEYVANSSLSPAPRARASRRS